MGADFGWVRGCLDVGSVGGGWGGYLGRHLGEDESIDVLLVSPLVSVLGLRSGNFDVGVGVRHGDVFFVGVDDGHVHDIVGRDFPMTQPRMNRRFFFPVMSVIRLSGVSVAARHVQYCRHRPFPVVSTDIERPSQTCRTQKTRLHTSPPPTRINFLTLSPCFGVDRHLLRGLSFHHELHSIRGYKFLPPISDEPLTSVFSPLAKLRGW